MQIEIDLTRADQLVLGCVQDVRRILRGTPTKAYIEYAVKIRAQTFNEVIADAQKPKLSVEERAKKPAPTRDETALRIKDTIVSLAIVLTVGRKNHRFAIAQNSDFEMPGEIIDVHHRSAMRDYDRLQKFAQKTEAQREAENNKTIEWLKKQGGFSAFRIPI